MATRGLFIMDMSTLDSRSHSQSRSLLASLSYKLHQRDGCFWIHARSNSHHLDQDFCSCFSPHRWCLNSISGNTHIIALCCEIVFFALTPYVTKLPEIIESRKKYQKFQVFFLFLFLTVLGKYRILKQHPLIRCMR